METDTDPVDLKEFAHAGRRPPRGRRYRLKVDTDRITVTNETVTGRQILELAGRTPVDDFVLILLLRGEDNEIIQLDEEIDLTRPGLERFVTGREDDIVVTIHAPRSAEPKDFTFDPDLLVREAAQQAAEAFGYEHGSPGLQKGDRPLDGAKSLEEEGVEHGDKLELFATGGGV